MPFQTPPHFALLITSKHDGGATLLPVSFDFIGDHERDTNSMEMFFGVSTRTQNNVQSINVKRIRHCRNANMSWHYAELVPNLQVTGLDVQDNFFVALASRIRPIRQRFKQAGVGVLTTPDIFMINDPRTTPIPLGNLDLLVQEKYQRKQFTESRHCFRYYANIWELNGQHFRQLSFLWKYIASLPRLVGETPCLTPFSTLPLDSIRFNPLATDQSSSAPARSVAQISRSTGLPMSLPLMDGEPACSYFVAGRCGQPCAALTPFRAYHIAAVLRSYSNEWFAEAETTLQISAFTKRINEKPLLPPMNFDNLATKQPHLIPKFIRLVANDAIFYDFEFSVMNSPYLAVPLELGAVRKDGSIVVDTAIDYGMDWSDLWDKVSLYMSPELVDHQQAPAYARWTRIHGGAASTGMTMSAIRPLLLQYDLIVNWSCGLDTQMYDLITSGNGNGPINLSSVLPEGMDGSWLHTLVRELFPGVRSSQLTYI